MIEGTSVPRAALRDPIVWGWLAAGALVRIALLLRYPVIVARGDEGLHYVGGALVSMLGTAHLGHWAPGYETLLGSLFWFTGPDLIAAKALQIGFSLATVLLLSLLAWRTGGARAGRIAAALAALFPSFIAYSQYFFAETLYIALLVGAVTAFYLRSPTPRLSDLLLSGILFGLAALTRSAVLYFFPIWIVWAWLRRRPEEARRAALVFGIALVVIAPWTVRNAFKYGGLVLVDGTLGRTAYLAYSEVALGGPSGRDLGLAGREAEREREPCPEERVGGFVDWPPSEELADRFPRSARKLLPKGALERKIERAEARGALDILARQRCEVAAALEFGARNPARVIAQTAWRLYAFLGPNSFLLRAVAWELYPDGPLAVGSYRFVKALVIGTELGLLLLAVLSLAVPRRSPFVEWSLVFGIFYTALHAASAASSRYRLPVMAFAIVLSALFLAQPTGSASNLRRSAVAVAAGSVLAVGIHYVATVLP